MHFPFVVIVWAFALSLHLSNGLRMKKRTRRYMKDQLEVTSSKDCIQELKILSLNARRWNLPNEIKSFTSKSYSGACFFIAGDSFIKVVSRSVQEMYEKFHKEIDGRGSFIMPAAVYGADNPYKDPATVYFAVQPKMEQPSYDLKSTPVCYIHKDDCRFRQQVIQMQKSSEETPELDFDRQTRLSSIDIDNILSDLNFLVSDQRMDYSFMVPYPDRKLDWTKGRLNDFDMTWTFKQKKTASGEKESFLTDMGGYAAWVGNASALALKNSTALPGEDVSLFGRPIVIAKRMYRFLFCYGYQSRVSVKDCFDAFGVANEEKGWSLDAAGIAKSLEEYAKKGRPFRDP